MRQTSPHTFHIPVMGLAYTIDTPIKVAKFGISSVVSIIEDHLVERMRAIICKEENFPYTPIPVEDLDHRAKRITAYLNLLQDIVDKQIAEIKLENFDTDKNINTYFEMLPENSALRLKYLKMKAEKNGSQNELKQELRNSIVAGSVDVNIMTKLDRTNYTKSGEELPPEYCDAVAALRGYASSRLYSSIIFSAGLNPRLFSFCEKYLDFYPDKNGEITKKIILKVSDFRSALIQGKYLAKKGLWVSEFRVESGINCGGHTFISNGIVLGPILEEFKAKRTELIEELHKECSAVLAATGKNPLPKNPELKISAQGGIGTADENNFLLDFYDLDATGWGSPFLLVPEVTNVDEITLQKIVHAKKEDYFLSNASPLGVPFSNFKQSTAEDQRKMRIDKNRPGSPCYKKFLSSNTEFSDKPICTASREYQHLKIIDLKKQIFDQEQLEHEIKKVADKDCLCEGLGAPGILKHNEIPAHNIIAVTICPGPNLAYFSDVFSLKQMVDHIYGRMNALNNLNRKNLFVNELQLYVDYIKNEIEDKFATFNTKKANHINSFKQNLLKGVEYYEDLVPKLKHYNLKENFLEHLNDIKKSIAQIPAIQVTC